MSFDLARVLLEQGGRDGQVDIGLAVLFNAAISRRNEQYGLAVVAGGYMRVKEVEGRGTD